MGSGERHGQCLEHLAVLASLTISPPLALASATIARGTRHRRDASLAAGAGDLAIGFLQMYEVLAGFSSVGFHALQFYARILLDGICNML